MNSHAVLSFLGRSSEDEEFDAWLLSQRIYDRPHRAEDDEDYPEDPDAALRNARDSEIYESERYSVALIYEDRKNYVRLFDFSDSSNGGNYVLKQVAFYGPGISNYSGYKSALPFALDFADSPVEVRKRLGPPFATRAIHGLVADLWVTPEWHINVSYTESLDRIAIVHVRRLHKYDARMLSGIDVRDGKDLVVDVMKLGGVLGLEVNDPRLAQALLPLDWSDDVKDEAEGADEVFSYVKRDGLTLYFRQVEDNDAPQLGSLKKGATYLAGFRLNRAGDMHSDGFDGQLPLGLEFHHTPDDVVGKIQHPPSEKGVAADTGYYIWEFNYCRVHVVYSLIDWQVYRVTCFAPFVK
jgi:hypothetical protein